MRNEFQPEDRELMVDLLGMCHTIKLRLDDLEGELETDSDVHKAIEYTVFKAHDLLVALSINLIN